MGRRLFTSPGVCTCAPPWVTSAPAAPLAAAWRPRARRHCWRRTSGSLLCESTRRRRRTRTARALCASPAGEWAGTRVARDVRTISRTVPRTGASSSATARSRTESSEWSPCASPAYSCTNSMTYAAPAMVFVQVRPHVSVAGANGAPLIPSRRARWHMSRCAVATHLPSPPTSRRGTAATALTCDPRRGARTQTPSRGAATTWAVRGRLTEASRAGAHWRRRGGARRAASLSPWSVRRRSGRTNSALQLESE